MSPALPFAASSGSTDRVTDGAGIAESKLRILLVSYINNNSHTGAGKWTHRVAANLRNRGHSVDLLFREDFPLTTKFGRWTVLIFPLVLAALLLRRAPPAPSVVVIHEPSGFWFGLARRFHLTSIPMIAMSHGVESRVFRDLVQAEDHGWVPKKAVRRWTTPILRSWQSDAGVFRLADQCYLPFAKRRNLLASGARDNGNARITLTPNGADAMKVSENIERFDVIFLGSWIAEKGSHLFPRLWDIVIKRRPDTSLLLVGTGKSREAVLGEFAPDSRRQIEIVESFEGEGELARHFGSARIFLLPSVREGSPLALLEAMAAGKAVVASRVGGVDDIVSDEVNGLLFDPGDLNGAASCLLRLLDNPGLRKRLGNAALATSSGLTWARTATAVEEACYAARGKCDAGA